MNLYLSIGLPKCPHDTAAGFPHKRKRERELNRDRERILREKKISFLYAIYNLYFSNNFSLSYSNLRSDILPFAIVYWSYGLILVQCRRGIHKGDNVMRRWGPLGAMLKAAYIVHTITSMTFVKVD